MIPTVKDLEDISKQREGSLEQVPFALLLRALSLHERTVVLELRRRMFFKRIVIEFGVPVDCQTNSIHDWLGRFLVSRGQLTEAEHDRYYEEAASQDVPLGNVLVAQEVLSAWELFRALQQNLAKKLLDGFAWYDGEYRMLFDVPSVDSPLKVKVPQLILTGLSRFAPQRETDATVMTLVGKKIGVSPQATELLGELKLTAPHRLLVKHLDQPRSLSELEGSTGLSMDEISRYVYAFGILGIVATEDELATLSQRGAVAAAPADSTSEMPRGQRAVNHEDLRNEIMTVYLAHRGQDAFELLGLEESADPGLIEERFIHFAEHVAPWSFEEDGIADLRDKARDLFLAAARSYAALADGEQRNTLLFRRKVKREEPSQEVGPQRIKTDLLDPEIQFRKGRELIDAGQLGEALQYLEFASDCDPQNGFYRAELSYCRFLWSPGKAQEVLRELQEARRIDPSCGLAHFYAGEVAAELERFDEAEESYRSAIKLMKPDRRPIEALKGLAARRKKGR